MGIKSYPIIAYAASSFVEIVIFIIVLTRILRHPRAEGAIPPTLQRAMMGVGL